MSARSTSLLGYGLYFIDVLACLLFAVSLALVGARFGHEQTVPIELPRAERSDAVGSDVPQVSIAIRSSQDGPEIFLGEERLALDALEARLREAPPPAVVVRSEASTLSRVIAIAHGAGIRDIQLAYEVEREEEAR